MKKYWKRLLAVTTLLLLVLFVWLFWPDARMAQAVALQKELANSQSLTAEQRRTKWDQYRKLVEKLTPAQRELLSQEPRKRKTAEMARYFAMSPQDKTRHLDERIRGMEQMRKQFEAKAKGKGTANGAAKQPGPAGQSGPGGRGSNSTPASRDQSRQQRLDSSTPAERAMFAQYMKDLNARRQQLGLPAGGRGFGPPR